MLSYKLYWIDAFTETRFGGNPCAVVLSADSLSDKMMQQLAREINLSETAFVLRSNVADFAARYFTPAEEIPLAGHPTISAIHALIDDQKILLDSPVKTISLELQAGVITVEIINDDPRTIIMYQKRPVFSSIHDPDKIAAIFGLKNSEFIPNVPIQTVSTGTPQLMIPVNNHDVLRKAAVNVSLYKDYREKSDFFSPHLFCLGGVTPNGSTFARHLDIPPDILEDPFTGSATGGMAAYLWRYELISKPTFIAEQGHWMERAGQATVEVVGSRSDIETIKIGGQATTLLRGTLKI